MNKKEKIQKIPQIGQSPVKPAIEMNIFEILFYRTKRVVWMNVPILTVEGNFHHERIEYPVIVFKIIDEVCKMPDTRPYSFLSAVGHEATAIAVNAVVGKFSFIPKVEVNRILYRYVEGDICIVLKMRGRILEGKVLNLEEMENIGYDFFAIWKI